MRSLLMKMVAVAKRAWTWGFAHKIWSTVIILVVLAAGYWAHGALAGSSTASEYVIGAATRGTLAVTVEGSGQVEANQSIDLAPKSSGTVTYVGVKSGDTVTAGTIIARIDDTDAEKSLRDAAADLTSAQIAYQQSITSSQSDETQAKASAFSSASTAITDTSNVLKDLNDALYTMSKIPAHQDQESLDAYAAIVGGSDGDTQRSTIKTEYQTAEDAYENALSIATGISPTSSDSDIQNLANAAYDAATKSAAAVNDLHDLMTVVKDKLQVDSTPPQAFTTQLSTITSDETEMNGDVSSVFSAKNSLDSAVATLGGTSSTPLDIQSAQLALTKAQNAYQDAEDNLENYIVRAPFDGTIAAVDVQTYDQSSGTVATLITTDQYAQLSLNEVDAAKVKVGQKAVLTFDAIDGLTLSGTVAEVDSVGTVSQGVVTYDVKISFDSQDARVKPGMTVDATITTDSVDNAVIVPSAAVTTVGGQSYVQVVTGAGAAAGGTASTTRGFGARNRSASTTPGSFGSTTASSTFRGFANGSSTASSTGAFTRTAATETVDASSVTVERVPVTVGISNDTMVEITSGLNPGQFIVERTTTGATATTQSKSIFSLFGGTRTATTGATRTTTGTAGTARAGGAGFGGGGAAAGGAGGRAVGGL